MSHVIYEPKVMFFFHTRSRATKICNMKKIGHPSQNEFGTLSQKTGLKGPFKEDVTGGRDVNLANFG